MNRSTLALAAVIFLGGAYWLGNHQGQAQDRGGERAKKDDDKRVLTTSGQASLRVKPDSARVFFRVENYGQQVRESRAENAQKVKKVMDALQALKIPNLKMKSSNLSFQPVIYNFPSAEMKLPKVLGYHATNNFTVLVENEDAIKLAEAASKVLDTALESGATGVEQIVFFKRNVEDIRRQALTKAVEEAMANARALARGADEKIASAITISGEPRIYYGGRTQNTQQNIAFLPGNGSDTPLVAGDLEITCNVSVTCRY
jgi:uncharacterized protein YggE